MPPRAAAQGAAGAQGQNGQQQQQQGGLNQLVATVLRFALMWYMMSYFKGSQNQPAAGTPAGAAAPLYAKGELVDMYVYLSESPIFSVADRSSAELIWTQTEIPLASGPERTGSFVYKPTESVHYNGSLYSHVVFARSGIDLNSPLLDEIPADSVFTATHSLIRYLPERQNKTGVNLLTTSANLTTQKAEPEAPKQWVSFLKPNLTIAMVDHFVTYPKTNIPPPINQHLVLNADGQQLPLISFEDFWLLRDKLVPMNSSVEEVTLQLSVKPQKLWWWQIQQQMEQSFSMQINMGLAQDGESDEMKRIFLEGNPYLLALTMAVSMLHSVFDFLAFKNDIGFWKENKSMEGLSARSIVINAFCQLVIFLYLLDNETSMVVLASAGIGTAIEFWKVTKAMDVSVSTTFPYLSIKDRASYSNNPTKEYDRTAMRYLSYALYPLVIGYSIYALMYETHKSWYSWLLGSLVGAVYLFGFILMCPQLYLNYKLKSVAHLPWRQMTYKFLNTIIDDLFAFVIKMPILHRISVFRDDLIFLIYLYQRWIYRVDMTRVNEFGFSGEQKEEAEAAAAAAGGQAALTEGAANGEEGAAGSTRRRKAAAAAAAAEQVNGSSEEEDEDLLAAGSKKSK